MAEHYSRLTWYSVNGMIHITLHIKDIFDDSAILVTDFTSEEFEDLLEWFKEGKHYVMNFKRVYTGL